MDPSIRVQMIIELHVIILCIFMGVIMLYSQEKIFKGGRLLPSAVFLNALLLLFDMLSWITDGSSNIFGAFLVRLSNYFVYLLEFLLVLMIAEYVNEIVQRHNKNYPKTIVKIVQGIALFDIFLLLTNPWTGVFFVIDAQNCYHRMPTFRLSMVLALICMILVAAILFQNWKHLQSMERMVIAMFLIYPAIGASIQIFTYGVSLVNIGITISIFAAFLVYMVKLMRWKRGRDLLILKSQAYLLNSQIKPHFLFNCLNVIQSLIEEDPETAVKAVDRFSKFQRTGLKIETMDSMVPLKTELNYVEDYLYLEKLRHGDKIQVIREIDPDLDFQLPFLTLQPIVENAVRHGICKRIKGGTVAIDIKKVPGFYEIRIVDDGIGFLPIEKVEKDWDPGDGTSSGVGVANVKKRLAMMCGGTLEVDSALGKGTMVLIRIPGKELC